MNKLVASFGLSVVLFALLWLFLSPAASSALPEAGIASGEEYVTQIREVWIADNTIYARILQPDPNLYAGQHFPAVILVPDGLAAGAPLVEQAQYRELARQGFIVAGFNAPGRGNGTPGNLQSAGNEDCNGFAGQDALKAMIEYVAGLPNVDAANIGVQSYGYGIAMAAGALGRYPDLPVRYLVDMEGPSDSLFATLHYNGQERPLCGHWSVISDTTPENVAWWSEREAYRFIGNFRGYYLRGQAEFDHVQASGIYSHALRLNNAAVLSGTPWVRINGLEMGNPISRLYTRTLPLWLPGRQADYPNLAVNYIIEMARRFGAVVTQTWYITSTGRQDQFLDVDRLENGNTLITNAGYFTSSRILEVDPHHRVVALYIGDLRFVHNSDRLENGHTLFSDTNNDRVIEIDAENCIVWNSDAVRLSDGSRLLYPNDANWLPESDHLLITERNNHRVIEIDRTGRIVWQFGITGIPGSDAVHLRDPHNADRLPNGNTIIADTGNNRVIEVNQAGQIVWMYADPTPGGLLWARDADRLPNGNTLITSSGNDRIIEVDPTGRVVWQYTNLNQSFTYDADRLPNGNTLIADSAHERVIEVNPAGQIVWEYTLSGVPTIPQGAIVGTVRSVDGTPIAGARVSIYGAANLSATTNVNGRYVLAPVRSAAPRYILLAFAPGYRPAQQGNVDVEANLTTTVDFILAPGYFVPQHLQVRVGYLLRRDPTGPRLIPPFGAVLDPARYPAHVLPYLEPGQFIESDDPAIIALAQSILNSVSPISRTDSTAVAYAVYVWMAQHIEVDAMPFFNADITTGEWQFTNGGWGHSAADWYYTARETLRERRGIRFENARLAAALLRALGIPARIAMAPVPPPSVRARPVTQWWVQLPDGNGFWANMETMSARLAYKTGEMSGFGTLADYFGAFREDEIGMWSPDAASLIDMDWWTERPAILRNWAGGPRPYPLTPAGLAEAQNELARFAATGVLTASGGPLPVPHYWLYARGFHIDLTNAAAQSTFVISFPLPIETITYTQLISIAHWSDHPEWIKRVYTTSQHHPVTGQRLPWYVLELVRRADLSITQKLTPAGPLAPGQVATYTLHYSNAGPEVAGGVNILSELSPELTPITFTCSGPPVTPAVGIPYLWQVGNLAPGQHGIITLTVQVITEALAYTPLAHRVTITSALPDPRLDNNSSVVHSSVRRVQALRLAPDLIGLILPSQSLPFSHTVTNAGNYTDVVTLRVGSVRGWPVALLESAYPTGTARLPLQIGPRASRVVTVSVTAPPGVLSNTVDYVVVTATLPTGVYALVTDTLVVGYAPAVEFGPDRTAAASPGASLVYTHTLVNAGNYTDTFQLTITPEWRPTLSPTSTTLGPAAMQIITVTLTVPMTLSRDAELHTTITATLVSTPAVWRTVTDTTYVRVPVRVYLPLVVRE